jgi:hypothetical protein
MIIIIKQQIIMIIMFPKTTIRMIIMLPKTTTINDNHAILEEHDYHYYLLFLGELDYY